MQMLELMLGLFRKVKPVVSLVLGEEFPDSEELMLRSTRGEKEQSRLERECGEEGDLKRKHMHAVNICQVSSLPPAY